MSEERISACPLCLKKETPRTQDLVCGDCVHAGVEIIRNSVIENERLNGQMRNDINTVFEVCAHIQAGGEPYDEDKFNLLRYRYEPPKPDVIYNKVHATPIPRPSLPAVKNLALQLEKLEILNSSLRAQSIDRTKDNLLRKITILQSKIDTLEAKVGQGKSVVQEKKELLQKKHSEHSLLLELHLNLLKGEKLKHVSRQSILLQHAHYNVIREVALLSSLGLRSVPMLYKQPVLRLSSFVENNSKLTTINTFLENLIRLQIALSDLFRVDNEALELPYLDQLREQLPESKFYESMQKRIMLIMHGGTIPEEDDAEENLVQTDLVEGDMDAMDKIVIRDNVIKVPISSRTRNSQRRASIKTPERESQGGTPGGTPTEKSPQVEERQERKLDPTPEAGPPSPAIKASAKAKQYVLVPHYILNKPFPRLKAEEYLRFILVVVKILINFNELLACTIHTVPGPRLKHQNSSGTLAGTFNTLRLNITQGTEDNEKEFLYDFEKILAKLANMDAYFKHREMELYRQKEIERSHSSSVLGLSAISNNSDYESASEHSEPVLANLPNVNSARFTLRNIYGLFRGKKPAAKRAADPTEDTIYGIVSETQSRDEEESPKTEIKDPQQGYDVRAIAATVHNVIAKGNGSYRGKSLGAKHEAFLSATLSMMAQSKAHLDEWDVVSRMY